MGVEGDGVVVGFERTVPHHEVAAGSEVYGILHPFDVYVFHEDVLEGADLQGEIVRGQIRDGQVVDMQVFDIEEGQLAFEAHDGGDVYGPVRPGIQAVAAQVQPADVDVVVVRAGEGAPVDEREPRDGPVRSGYPAEHHPAVEGETGVGIDRQRAADIIDTSLPDVDGSTPVQASLQGFCIGRRIVPGQEAEAVGILHLSQSGRGMRFIGYSGRNARETIGGAGGFRGLEPAGIDRGRGGDARNRRKNEAGNGLQYRRMFRKAFQGIVRIQETGIRDGLPVVLQERDKIGFPGEVVIIIMVAPDYFLEGPSNMI